MRRKLRLILAILEFAEETITPGRRRSAFLPEIDGYETDDIDYHVELCGQAGYMQVEPMPNGRYKVRELTWAGHEALANLREQRSRLD